MKIAIASDHAGYEIKEQLVRMLSEEYCVINFGTFSSDSCDYPDYAKKVALAVQKNEVDRGILICATGEGMCIVANKFRGVRAGVCYSDEVAKLLSEHNFANIICFPSKVKLYDKEITPQLLYRWTKIWLETNNSKEDRHYRRMSKIITIEEENFKK
ncbi:MAG: RpiB/LacA/LacB family sugar-phosphate isomerase [Endomicrobia bacterium]|nr:RpiB/LacA/LacB family sugar-phosphate isomerase [Endomicrobiia bacterium]